jgi:hypothetical protein
MLWGFTLMIIKYKSQSRDTAMKNYYILRAGKNVESTGTTRIGYYDHQHARQMMPLHSMLYYDLPGKSLVVNPCRDQNYRKYFQMRKKHNITTLI